LSTKNVKFQGLSETTIWSLTLHSFSDEALWMMASNVKSNPTEGSYRIASLFIEV